MATKKSSAQPTADAAASDPRKDAIFACIQAAFADSGLTPITSPLNNINWPQIPVDVKDDIADFLQKCIAQKIKDPGDLVGPIRVLSAHQPVMAVADLINDLLALLG